TFTPHRVLVCYFFFQAEDGIRDPLVTGVQTCALPILNTDEHGSVLLSRKSFAAWKEFYPGFPGSARFQRARSFAIHRARKMRARSEERRVGKEGRYGRSEDR